MIFACLKEVDGAKPFFVGCRESSKKTELNEFLEQTVSDLLELETFGLAKLDSIVADSPARAYILRIACPGGVHACSRCWIRRVTISIRKRGNAVVYKEVYPRGRCPARARTHDEYLNQVQPEGPHRGVSMF